MLPRATSELDAAQRSDVLVRLLQAVHLDGGFRVHDAPPFANAPRAKPKLDVEILDERLFGRALDHLEKLWEVRRP